MYSEQKISVEKISDNEELRHNYGADDEYALDIVHNNIINTFYLSKKEATELFKNLVELLFEEGE